MAYVPNLGSVVAFQSNADNFKASIQGTVGASIIGLPPVNITNTNVPIAGSVAAFIQSTNASIITVGGATGNSSVQVLNFPTSQNVNGSVVAFQGTSPWIITGSVQTTVNTGNSSVQVLNFPTNQSVSGTVATTQAGTWISSIVNIVPSSVIVGASIFGLPPVNVTNTNLNVGGSVVAFQGAGWSGSVAAAQIGTRVTSIVGAYTEPNVVTSMTGVALVFKSNISSSVMTGVSVANPLPVSVQGTIGASIMGLPPVNVTNTNLNVGGSVISFQGGTQMTSLVSITPSSVLVGASIFGLPPVNVTNTNLNVGGSVVAFQGAGWSGSVAAVITNTPNVNTAGSVVAFQGTNPWVVGSIVGTYATNAVSGGTDAGQLSLGYRNDTLASIVGADKDYLGHAFDSAGRTIIKPFTPEDGTIINYTGSIVSGSVTLIQASAIGKRSYITDYWIQNTGSTFGLLTFKDGSTSVIGYGAAPATGGSNSQGINIPIKTAPSQDLVFSVSPSQSILYLTVKGYQAP